MVFGKRQTAFGKEQTILANFDLILAFNFVGEIEWQIFLRNALRRQLLAWRKKFGDIDPGCHVGYTYIRRIGIFN